MMSPQQIDVLVYSDAGTSDKSLKHCLYTLKQVLSYRYAVREISADELIKQPWEASCALLVLPGGRDQEYCRKLNGQGNARIKRYVGNGGSYLGCCAGGYYGSEFCNFEINDPSISVVEGRELAFFPGGCVGSVSPNFKYGSDEGALATTLWVDSDTFQLDTKQYEALRGFKAYLNGGGVFSGAGDMKTQGVTVLANYMRALNTQDSVASAAVVHCKFGQGQAVLTGPHIEFEGSRLEKDTSDIPTYVLHDLKVNDKARDLFLRQCLKKLNLQLNPDRTPGTPPQLTPIRIFFINSKIGSEVTSKLAQASSEHLQLPDDGVFTIIGGHNQFRIQTAAKYRATFSQAYPLLKSEDNLWERNVVLHTGDRATTEYYGTFDQDMFFRILEILRSRNPPNPGLDSSFGNAVMYSQIVDSTNTVLEKNPVLTSHLPNGTIFTAEMQLSGRGRGSNAWVSPSGSLMFSIILRHAVTPENMASVTWIQYLAAMSVVEGVKKYRQHFDDKDDVTVYNVMPIRLKWPNDIYIFDTSVSGANFREPSAYVKIGGVLVNSSYTDGLFQMTIGIGLNLSNPEPTTCLNKVLASMTSAGPMPMNRLYRKEPLVAAILKSFEDNYYSFLVLGFNHELEQTYYLNWLHTGQIVTLEGQDGARVQIEGITRDTGCLVVQGLMGTPGNEMPTGDRFVLEPDYNSFDFFKGLIRKKAL